MGLPAAACKMICGPIRLEKDNPHVKHKCLKIIKHVARLHARKLRLHTCITPCRAEVVHPRFVSRANQNSSVRFKERPSPLVPRRFKQSSSPIGIVGGRRQSMPSVPGHAGSTERHGQGTPIRVIRVSEQSDQSPRVQALLCQPRGHLWMPASVQQVETKMIRTMNAYTRLNQKTFYFEHPHPAPGTDPGFSGHNPWLGTQVFCEESGVGHSMENSLGLAASCRISGVLWDWALLGLGGGVGHSGDWDTGGVQHNPSARVAKKAERPLSVVKCS